MYSISRDPSAYLRKVDCRKYVCERFLDGVRTSAVTVNRGCLALGRRLGVAKLHGQVHIRVDNLVQPVSI